MIQPVQIRFRHTEGAEVIEIATGDYLGHEVGTMSYLSGHTPPRYSVNGTKFFSFDAALHACMAEAYRYIAQQRDEEAADAYDPADDAS